MSYAHSTLSPLERLASLSAASTLPVVVALAVMIAGLSAKTITSSSQNLVSFTVKNPVEEVKPTKQEPQKPKPQKHTKSKSNSPAPSARAVTPNPSVTTAPPSTLNAMASDIETALPSAQIGLASSNIGDGTGENGQGTGQGSAPAQTQSSSAGSKGRGSGDQYGNAIYRSVRSHQRYTPHMRRLGVEGTVTIAFTVNHRGRLRRPHIANSSGVALLDRAAMHQLRSAAPFPRPPKGKPRSFEMPLTYRPRD